MTLAEFEQHIFAVAIDSSICDIPNVRRLTSTSTSTPFLILLGTIHCQPRCRLPSLWPRLSNSPEAAQAAIQAAAERAVRRLGAGEAPPPFRLQNPITLAVECVQPEMADRAMLLPGARRAADKKVEFTADDVPAAYRAFQVMAALASG